MVTPLATRLTRLLDVVQRVHNCKRTVAARVVAEHVPSLSHTLVSRLATGAAWHIRTPDSHYDAPLSQLERRYRRSLRALVALDAACARDRAA